MKEDYISALHVLVPRVEQMIRRIFKAIHLDITAFKDGSMKERSLGEMIREADKKGAIEKSISKYIRAVLSEEWGWNLRNKIAHGLINVSECVDYKCNRIIHLILLLSTLKIESV